VTAAVVVTRFRWFEQAFTSTQGTLAALVEYVVADEKLVVAATPRLIRTLDRFLPGPQPLSATAASILDGAAAQAKPGATFAQLSRAQKAQVFATLERLPVENAGSIRFLVGNPAVGCVPRVLRAAGPSARAICRRPAGPQRAEGLLACVT
jgi:hypothetical protein